MLRELEHFFTRRCRRRPHPTAHPHLGPKRVSLPYFTHDHVVGALCPPPPAPYPGPLHPDLGLTSSVTGVSGPDSCRPGGEGEGQWLPRLVPWAGPLSVSSREGSPGPFLEGPPLQLPGLGHHRRDMLLFLILFFYEKNQCQSTDPLRNQADRAEPAAPLPSSESQWRGAALPSLQDGVGPGLRSPGSPSALSHQRVHLTLECTTQPAVGKALRPQPLPLAAVLSLSPCRPRRHLHPELEWVAWGPWAWREGSASAAWGRRRNLKGLSWKASFFLVANVRPVYPLQYL